MKRIINEPFAPRKRRSLAVDLLPSILMSGVLWLFIIWLAMQIVAAIEKPGNPFQLVAEQIERGWSEGK